MRGVTCSRDTPAAFISDQQAADFAGGVLNGVTLGTAHYALPDSLDEKVNWGSGWNVAGSVTGAAPWVIAGWGDATTMFYVSGGAALVRTYGQCTGAPYPGAANCFAHGGVNAALAGVGFGLGGLYLPAGGAWGGGGWIGGSCVHGWIDEHIDG